MDDISVSLGVSAPVVHVPAEAFAEGVDEIEADLRLVVRAGKVFVSIVLEALYKGEDFARDRHEGAFVKRETNRSYNVVKSVRYTG